MQIYEIDTNPTLEPDTRHQDATHRESLRLVWTQQMAALRELDPGTLPGAPVALRDPRLERHQGLLGRLIRSRETP